MSRRFEFSLNLSADKTKSIYAGRARYILVYTDEGTSIQLPAVNFRRYVTEQGIHGRFEVEVDGRNRIINLRPV